MYCSVEKYWRMTLLFSSTDEDHGERKINIVDVLKPPEDDPVSPGPLSPRSDQEGLSSPGSSPDKRRSSLGRHRSGSGSGAGASGSSGGPPDQVTRWVVCAKYRDEQKRLGIPNDPAEWNESHVSHWIRWAIGQARKPFS